MKKERKEESFIKQPYYKGGEKALREFVSLQLRYPEISKLNKIEGDVHIKYDINYKGEVTDTKIIGGLDEACNEEAARVVKLLKFIVPKTPRHLKVTFHKTIRIHFHLNEVQSAPLTEDKKQAEHVNTEMQINYTINYTPVVLNGAPPAKQVNYNYVIRL